MAAFTLACGGAIAAPFQNGSFESGGVVPCNTFNIPAGSTLITGWTVSVGNIDWLGAPVPACGWQASNGIASLDLVGSAAGGIGGISQTFDTVPGQTYVLSFDLAGNFGAPPVIKPLAVTINGVTTNFTFDTTGATGDQHGVGHALDPVHRDGRHQHRQFRQRRQRVRRHVERGRGARQRAGHRFRRPPAMSRSRWIGRTGPRCCC